MLYRKQNTIDEKSVQDELSNELLLRTRSACLSQILLFIVIVYFLGGHLAKIHFAVPLLGVILVGIALRLGSSFTQIPFYQYRKVIHHFGSLLIGLGWGILPVLTMQQDGLSSIETISIIIIGSGVAAGGSYSLAPVAWLSQLFCAVTLLPLVIFTSFSSVEQSYLISILVGIFIFFLMTQAKYNYQLLKNNFILVKEKIWEIEKYNEAQLEIADQKEKNQQMVKLAALGTMAGGIAHEINNPLAVILARVTLMRKIIWAGEAGSQSKLNDELDRIEKTCLRVSKIIKGLKSFAKMDNQSEMEYVSLKSIFEETFEWCRPRFKEKQVHFAEPKIDYNILIYCRPVQISEVILNLCNNSIDAIEDLEEKWVRIEVSENETEVVIQFLDSGSGIPENVRSQIFNPFFTTKAPQKGTGLGLSICHQIVSEHLGELTIDVKNPNTCFQLKFPKHKAKSLKAS